MVQRSWLNAHGLRLMAKGAGPVLGAMSHEAWAMSLEPWTITKLISRIMPSILWTVSLINRIIEFLPDAHVLPYLVLFFHDHYWPPLILRGILDPPQEQSKTCLGSGPRNTKVYEGSWLNCASMNVAYVLRAWYFVDFRADLFTMHQLLRTRRLTVVMVEN